MKCVPESLGYENSEVQIIFYIFFLANPHKVSLVPLRGIEPMIEFCLFSMNNSKFTFKFTFCDKSF